MLRAGWGLLVMVVSLVGGYGCATTEAHEGGPGPIPVRVRDVESRTASGGTRYSGAIQPVKQVDVAFKVAGYVERLGEAKDGAKKRELDEGDVVKKRQLLAQVKRSEYTQQLALAKASVAEAEAAAKQAKLDADRATKLVQSDVIPKAQYEAAKMKLESAEARVLATKAQSGQAALSVGDTSLESPMDGVILRKGVEVGSLVNPGAVAFVVADMTKVKVVFGVPDTLVEKLAVGSPVTVTLEARREEIQATVSLVAPSADSRSRLFDVEVELPNPDGNFRAGMIAALKVPDAQLSKPTILLPLTAVVRSKNDPRGFAVFIVSGDAGHETVAMKDVKLGDVLGNQVVVTGGLTAGVQVVSQGASLVSDGDAVRIIK